MGISSVKIKKERIESKMLMLKLKKIEIKQERKERINQLKELTGKEIIRESIPDYIDNRDDDDIDLNDINNEDNIGNNEEKEIKDNNNYY